MVVVDDDEIVLHTTCKLIRRSGRQVYGASSCIEALRLQREHNTHLILTDLMMPKINGRKLAQLARRYDPSVKLIITTAYPGGASVDAAGTLGQCDYLIKPVDAAELSGVVEAWMRRPAS